MNIEIIYEDGHMLALNKPSGIAVHKGIGEGSTLTDWILARYPKLKRVGEPIKLSSGEIVDRAGIAHRLDKETSGVIVIAKDEPTFFFLKKQFQERRVEKEYRAIVYGLVKEKSGTVTAPIGRDAKRFGLRRAGSDARGRLREAETKYSRLAHSKDFSYLSVFPKTGRTHQIRVHLKSIGHPVLCDRLYAKNRPCPEELGRLALHAYRITIHSSEGALLIFEAPLPANFKRTLELFRLA